MRSPRDYGWNPIETAPADEDIALQVTDGRGGRIRSNGHVGNRDWLDQFEEGNAAGGHADEVEAVPYPALTRPR